MHVYDKLTGLYEKTYFWSHLELEVQRCGRYGRPLSVLMVEPLFGFFTEDGDVRWAMGYTLIKQVGSILLGTLRTVDMACRHDGARLLVFLPETGEQGAAVAAERIRARVEGHEFMGRQPDEKVRLAVNVGVALFPHHGQAAADLLDSAEQALARAREEGGNRVVVLEVAERPETETATPQGTDAPESWDDLAAEGGPSGKAGA